MKHLCRIKKVFLFIKPAIALSILGFSFSSITFAQTEKPSIVEDILSMPFLTVADQTFSVNFEILDIDGIVSLSLLNFEEIAAIDDSSVPSFFSGLLNLPDLDVNGISYWGEFLQDEIDPGRFWLKDADINLPGESGLEGKWRIHEILDSLACRDGMLPEFATIDIFQDNELTVGSIGGVLSGSLINNILEWDASDIAEDGTTNTSLSVLFDEVFDNLNGTLSWDWTDGVDSCSGSMGITGSVLHN